jgi:hypothetical protein
MSKLTLTAAVLSLLSSHAMASQTAEHASSAPTAAELQEVIRASWPSFSRVIHQQDRLIEAPRRLASLPEALCRPEKLADTYECAFLVEYQLSNGTQRSTLLKNHFARDAEGRLRDVIVSRETPTPRSNEGVR